jgi:Flp pilus assembly protein TadD
MDLLIKQERWPELEALAQELEGGPNGPLCAASVRCRVSLGRGDFDAARQLVRQMIDRFPQAVEPRVLLSYVFLQEGIEWAAAEQALEDVLALDPGNQEARRNLAVLQNQRAAMKCGA